MCQRIRGSYQHNIKKKLTEDTKEMLKQRRQMKINSVTQKVEYWIAMTGRNKGIQSNSDENRN